MYQVRSAECSRPYVGPHSSRSIYVVGLGTEDEAFFARAQRREAVIAAREKDLTLDHLPAGQLCAEIVEAVFGV